MDENAVTDETPDETAVTSTYGRVVSYKFKGEDCEIHGFALSDDGVQFEFKRGERTYPLRLSLIGTHAMLALIQDILWNAPTSSPSAHE